MTRALRLRWKRSWLALGISLFAASCGSKDHDARPAIRLGDETLQQIKRGKTTEQWLRAVIGPPTSEARVEGIEPVHVLRYSTVESSTGFLSFFSARSPRTTATVYFIVTDGIVQNFWADRETEHKLFGGTESGSSSQLEPNGK